MARVVCINPCVLDATSNMTVPSVRIPYISKDVKPVLALDLKGGCDGCDLLANFMLQIQPYLISLQIPLCLLQCVMTIFSNGAITNVTGSPYPGVVRGAIDEVVGAFGSLPNPPLTDLNKAIANAGYVCASCFAFTPCKFACLLEDLLSAMLSIIRCVTSLLNGMITLNLKATGMSLNPNASIQEAAECLFGLIGVQKQNLGVKFNLIGAIFEVIGFLAGFVGISMPPVSITITVNTPLSTIASQLAALIPVITPVRDSAKAICDNCP